MDILLYDANFLVTYPIWSQYLQEPEIKNFTLLSDLWKLTLLNQKNWIFILSHMDITRYHQIQAEIVAKDPIFQFLGLYSQNSKVIKWVLCLWEQQIQPLFGNIATIEM